MLRAVAFLMFLDNSLLTLRLISFFMFNLCQSLTSKGRKLWTLSIFNNFFLLFLSLLRLLSFRAFSLPLRGPWPHFSCLFLFWQFQQFNLPWIYVARAWSKRAKLFCAYGVCTWSPILEVSFCRSKSAELNDCAAFEGTHAFFWAKSLTACF